MQIEEWKPPHRDADAAVPPPPPSKWRQVASYTATCLGFFAVTVAFLARDDLADWYHARRAATLPVVAAIALRPAVAPSEATLAQEKVIEESAAAAQSAEDAANQAAKAARVAASPGRAAQQ